MLCHFQLAGVAKLKCDEGSFNNLFSPEFKLDHGFVSWTQCVTSGGKFLDVALGNIEPEQPAQDIAPIT